MNSDSILNTIKKMLGVDADYTAYDVDIIVNINSSLATLSQLGAGPSGGFQIDSKDDEWSDYFTDIIERSSSITFVYLKAKIVFDPPASSTVLEAYQRSIDELSWRIRENASNNSGEEG